METKKDTAPGGKNDSPKPKKKYFDPKELTSAARLIIRGQTDTLGWTEDFASQLKDENKNAYAAELYYRLLDQMANNPKWRKQLAICLYKDPDLPASLKFNEALLQLALTTPNKDKSNPSFEKLIKNLNLLDTSEFLGVTGAVFKRRWQMDNQFQNLLLSEHFYRKGMEIWLSLQPENADPVFVDNDAGYCAINYAFLFDLITFVEFKQKEILGPSIVEEPAKTRASAAGAAPKSDMDKVLNFAKTADSTSTRLEISQLLRRNIITRLLGTAWDKLPDDFKKHPNPKVDVYNVIWVDATLAEAFFGLGQYEHAANYYARYRDNIQKEWEQKLHEIELEEGKDMTHLHQVNVDWKLKTTAEQLLWFADIKVRLLGKGKDADKKRREIQEGTKICLQRLFPNTFKNTEAITNLHLNGKVGLALSGGGFRASFFHIGVLAKLAELDVLRHIEVLSCVSGGSIVGAHYYLLLKKLLESKHESEINRSDYVELVKVLEEDFLQGVQKNLRMRIFDNPIKNFRIFFDKTYTRTHRLAELYEKFLYAKANGTAPDEPILIHKLRIHPLDEKTKKPSDSEFNPKTDNWNRTNKVPILVLNATSLNTGHNWQFTVSWMGEPPGSIRPDIDMKKRLRRMYYDQAPEPFKEKIRLGQAVGSSSCVPVLFEPFMMKDLYPGIELQLVDGGVHDNQGATSLLEQECRIMLVSDASGQLADSDSAAENAASVFFRTDSIFQARIRESQVMDLKAREDAAQLKAVAFVHLKKGLYQYPVNWKDSQEPTRRILRPPMASPDEDLMTYGVLTKVQDALAGIRTDLDAFNDVEAYALMYSGYRQMEEELKQDKFSALISDPATLEEAELKEDSAQSGAPNQVKDFQFKQIARAMTIPAESTDLLLRLKIGQQMVGKVFSVSLVATIVTVLFSGALLLVLLAPLAWWYWEDIRTFEFLFNWQKLWSWLLPTIILGVIAARLGAWFSKMRSWKNQLIRYGVLAVGAFVLALVNAFYVRCLNPKYLKFGAVDQLGKKNKWKARVQRVLDFL